MKILLDTHIFLWYLVEPERLNSDQIKLLSDQNVSKLLSIVSLWEITIKVSLGKLVIHQSIDALVPKEIELLPISVFHLQHLQTLPFHHRDPFDRLIVAQAIADNLLLCSIDESIKSYPVKLI